MISYFCLAFSRSSLQGRSGESHINIFFRARCFAAVPVPKTENAVSTISACSWACTFAYPEAGSCTRLPADNTVIN